MNMNDEKMSKSKGNLITADELADMYDIDSIRYYLIANNPEQRDVSFSHEDFIQAHNKFLVGVLGNFVNRNLSFINKKFDGVISKGNVDENIREKTKRLYNYVGDLIKQGELRNAIAEVIDYASMGNKYYDEMEPWKLVKEDIDKFNDVSFTCAYIIANLSNLVEPFMPRVSKDIKEMLSLEDASWNEIVLENDITINNCRLLFERIEENNK
jgi:methionyl-tRNA synthetase